MNRILEIAAFSYEAARIAASAGAGRIELCSSYAEGGLSPSPGTLSRLHKEFSIPVFVMIRPRGGNFVYSDAEADIMKRDLEILQQYGAAGIVTGALNEQNRIDEKLLRSILEATSLPVTFHRAFDLCSDRDEAMEILIAAGVKRILSSGGAKDAEQGAAEIARLNQIAAGRISFIPGGGVNPSNISAIASITGCSEFHASAKSKTEADQLASGFGEHVLPDPQIILALQNKIRN